MQKYLFFCIFATCLADNETNMADNTNKTYNIDNTDIACNGTTVKDNGTTAESSGIALERLVVGYRHGHAIKRLNAPATEQAACGQLTCLIGANGAGKSTLLRTIAAFQPPIEGAVRIAGHNVATLTPRQRAELMAVVLTDKPDTECTTVWEMAATGRTPYTGFWGRLSAYDRHIVQHSLQLVDMLHMAGRTMTSLSDGERQKVMIAKALAQQTPVLLLDEPTAFLDYPSKADIMLLLRHLARNEHKAVLLSTHDLELALQTASRLWLMQQGTLTSGTPQALAASGAIARFVCRGNVTFNEHTMTIKLKGE